MSLLSGLALRWLILWWEKIVVRFVRKIFKVFVSFSKFSDVFGPIRMRSDLRGRIRMHSDAFQSVWTLSDKIENFGILELVFDVSGCKFTKHFRPSTVPKALATCAACLPLCLVFCLRFDVIPLLLELRPMLFSLLEVHRALFTLFKIPVITDRSVQ